MRTAPIGQTQKQDEIGETNREQLILNGDDLNVSTRISAHQERRQDNDIDKYISHKSTNQDPNESQQICTLRKNAEAAGVTKSARTMTVEEILAVPPPPDAPEYISPATAIRKSQLFWAPLIGGTSMQERHLIDEELGITSQLSVHSEWIKIRTTDPGNLNKLLYFDGVNPDVRYPIAGVSKEPLSIDPPGSATPYDALKFPLRLVKLLNREDWRLFYDWSEEALNNIPNDVLALLDEAALHRLPISIRNKVLDKAPSGSFSDDRIAPLLSTTINEPLMETRPRLRMRNRLRSAAQVEESCIPKVPIAVASGKLSLISPRSPSKRDAKGRFVTPSAVLMQETTVAKIQPAVRSKSQDRAQNKDQDQMTPCESCLYAGIRCDGELPGCWWCVAQGWPCIRSRDAALFSRSHDDTSIDGLLNVEWSETLSIQPR